mmetsp:Transcript_624/g.1060  ORF Transcript_624/g.1060 Transcript_624/m.1060 type:complete len:352 (+) Transcript_624:3390-4445(+)
MRFKESRLRATALQLRFGDLWQKVADNQFEIDERKFENGIPLRFNLFQYLPDDVIVAVLSFLDARSLCFVAATCIRLYTFLSKSSVQALLWKEHHMYISSLVCLRGDLSAISKRQYLKLLLLYYEAEWRHFRTMERLLKSLCQMPKGAVVNIISNIGQFKDAAISLAVSAHRQIAMRAVILSRTQDAIVFRRQTDYVGPVTFFSQDNISPLLESNPSIEMPPIRADGFIGYAVNLIELDPTEEYMRYTFLLCAYKNLTIWTTKAAEETARRSNLLPSGVSSVALDTFARPHTGAIATWFKTGGLRMSNSRYPCFVAFGKRRPKFQHPDQVFVHMKNLKSRRDYLRLAIAKC